MRHMFKVDENCSLCMEVMEGRSPRQTQERTCSCGITLEWHQWRGHPHKPFDDGPKEYWNPDCQGWDEVLDESFEE